MSPVPGIWQLCRRSLDLSARPCLMGILNVTPDSFSDGNRYLSVEEAVERALRMEDEGADIIDIGGESSRPQAAPVSAEEELNRVMPVIERLARRISAPLSIDTYKAAVAREAVAAGVEIVNDISGLTFDDKMADAVATTGAGVVLMHTRGTPQEMQRNTSYVDVVAEVCTSLAATVRSAEAAGIAPGKIVVDPGIGFGKDAAGNMEILRRLDHFSSLGRPLLVGTSRKAFIGKILGRDVYDRTYGTAATVAYALYKGAAIFRVHDVKEMRDVLDMTSALLRGC